MAKIKQAKLQAAGGETPPPSPPHGQLSPAGYQIQLQCLFLNALRGVISWVSYHLQQEFSAWHTTWDYWFLVFKKIKKINAKWWILYIQFEDWGSHIHKINDAPALKKSDIGIVAADATGAARSVSDIAPTESGLSVIISAVLTDRAIFWRMKNYTIYAVSITIRTVLGFMLMVLIWEFDFSPFMLLIIAILSDGAIMTISKDRVKPSPLPDS